MTLAATLAVAVFSTGTLLALPTWIGVYGDTVRHSGGNPGTFTVLMNQDYYGLNAKLWTSVNGGAWQATPMFYSGNQGGNSKWVLTPNVAFPSGASVVYCFQGYDTGGSIYDSNGGGNYSLTATAPELYWLGNTMHSPATGSITPATPLSVLLQSWPRNGALLGSVLYTDNGGNAWYAKPLAKGAPSGNNDTWSALLGTFNWNSKVQYCAYLTDGAGNTKWDNNSGLDYLAQVNRDPSLAPNADADGDGLPNGYEYDIGFDPQNPADGMRDDDGDGLSNGTEKTIASDYQKADTDNDGVSDYVEHVGTLTSPTSAGSFNFVNLGAANLSSPSPAVTDWVLENGDMRCTGHRSSISYPITTTQSGVCHVTFDADVLTYRLGNSVRVRVDGTHIGKTDFVPNTSATLTRSILGPWLASGSHTVTIEWDNTYGPNQFTLKGLRLTRLSGADADGNGQPDWADRVLDERDTARVFPVQSLVSPAFIEGKTPYPGLVSINGGAISAKPSATGWYADVPLSATSGTAVNIGFENGGSSDANVITWKPCNLLYESSLTIRKGDSLRFSVDDLSGAGGTATVFKNGVQIASTGQANASTHTFTSAGSFQIKGRLVYGNTVKERTITVNVAAADLPNHTATCRISAYRMWSPGALGANVVLTKHPSLTLDAYGVNASGQPQFELGTPDYEPRYIEARAGSADGPILDTTPVNAVSAFGASYTWMADIHTLSDGSTVRRTGIIVTPKDRLTQHGVTVKLKILAAGVTFSDGTVEKVITPSMLDSNDVVEIDFVLPPNCQTAACHNFEVKQNTIPISY